MHIIGRGRSIPLATKFCKVAKLFADLTDRLGRVPRSPRFNVCGSVVGMTRPLIRRSEHEATTTMRGTRFALEFGSGGARRSPSSNIRAIGEIVRLSTW